MRAVRPIPRRGESARDPASGTRLNDRQGPLLGIEVEESSPPVMVPEDAGITSSQCYNAI